MGSEGMKNAIMTVRTSSGSTIRRPLTYCGCGQGGAGGAGRDTDQGGGCGERRGCLCGGQQGGMAAGWHSCGYAPSSPE